MANSHKSGHREWLRARLLSVGLAFALTLLGWSARAMTEIADEDLGGVDGAGMVFAWTDFRFLMNPTSYIEQAGSATSSDPTNSPYCSATGSGSGNQNCWRRGDLRWYGLAVSGISGTGTDTSWTSSAGVMTACSGTGINGLGCPRGGPIAYFGAQDNPYVLRVMDYAGDGSAASAIGNGIVTYQGNNGTADWSNGSGAGSKQTVLEWLAPVWNAAQKTGQDNYRLAFWGEVEAGRGGTGGGSLKSQTIIQGNAAGSVLRFFKFTQTTTAPGLADSDTATAGQQTFNPLLGVVGCTDGTNSVNATASTTAWGCSSGTAGASSTASSAYNNRSLAIQYISHLRGDMRFSVAQATGGSDVLGTPVVFDSNEGFYFRNSDVFLPIGQPFYQALTINVPRSNTNNNPVTDGNFTLEMPLIPNVQAVYTRFYSLTDYTNNSSNPQAPNAWDDGYATTRAAYLYSLPVTGGTTPAYMPARTAATITNYSAPDANYANTHGYAHWGDWFVCQGVGCRLPQTANAVADASAGTGRNAWNSSGDGVFFVGKTAFNAYAYSILAKDVRDTSNTNYNQYTSFDYYANYSACTPANATDYAKCGNGGAYLGNGGTNTSTSSATGGTSVTATTIVPPENEFLNKLSQGFSSASATASRNMIAVSAGTPLNLGDSRIDGIQLNYLRFTSYGAK